MEITPTSVPPPLSVVTRDIKICKRSFWRKKRRFSVIGVVSVSTNDLGVQGLGTQRETHLNSTGTDWEEKSYTSRE